MKNILFSEFLTNQSTYIQLAREGGVFVYPTDTIYGVWWIITAEVVETINAIKKRQPGKHYSIIVPSFDWVQKRCDVWDDFSDTWSRLKESHCITENWSERWLTVLVPVKTFGEKKSSWIPNFSLLSPTQKIWIRFIDHPFQQFVTNLWEPFITTSINISGQENITSVELLHPFQQDLVDIVLDDGILWWEASVVVDLKSGVVVRG